MPNVALSLSDVEELVADSARGTDIAVTRDHIHVHEEPDPSGGPALAVQIATRRPANRDDWAKLRLRLSQNIRDRLLEHGDERFPIIEVFEPEEWLNRDE